MQTNIDREVILDLLPAYLSGEASLATNTLIENYLKQDAELAQQVRRQKGESWEMAPPALPPELELQSLQRTRRMLAWGRWMFALAFCFSVLTLWVAFSPPNGHFQGLHSLFRGYPAPFKVIPGLGLACWIAYFSMLFRIRFTGFSARRKT